MADFLTAVKSVQKKPDGNQEALLTPVSTSQTQQSHNGNESQDQSNGNFKRNPLAFTAEIQQSVRTAEDALVLLRSQPDTQQLITVLHQLNSKNEFEVQTSLDCPGTVQAQIINTLVDSTLPTFWSVLDGKHRNLLVACLRNVTGISAVVASIRKASTTVEPRESGVHSSPRLTEFLSVLNDILRGNNLIAKVLSGLSAAVQDRNKFQLAWKEFVNIISSGKVISTIAQAEDASRITNEHTLSTWMSSGAEYAAWLGRNVAALTLNDRPNEKDHPFAVEAAAQILGKALNLGYPQPLIKSLISATVDHNQQEEHAFNRLSENLSALPVFSQRRFLEHMLVWLSTLSQETWSQRSIAEDQSVISSIAALLFELNGATETIHQELQRCLSDPRYAIALSLPVRRAIIPVLAQASSDDLDSVLEKSMSVFADQSFANHAPILQQESIAQDILLSAAYVHRNSPMSVLMTARSSSHMQGVSNRLDSSNPRARWLGMIVGTAMSNLVDKEGSKMNFGTDDMQTDEARWYRDLTTVRDEVGQLSDFKKLLQAQGRMARKERVRMTKTEELPILNGKQSFGPPRPPHMVQTEIIGERIREIADEEDTGDDNDLQPYAKPDSDPEDSDEDATLVNRNKPQAPVYIRDLMRMLGDDQNHDRFQMGIKHAAPLIRRKANFGAEVLDHAEELAGMLCSLQDPFATEGFDELRLQALIAVLLSDVKTLAPWLSRQVFGGDYSLAQRCLMLSALGLAGRELAGYKNEDDLNPAILDEKTNFPSKRLPGRLHAIYSPSDSSVKRLESASKSVEQRIIKPMALYAADESTSHLNAVKVRTFSSRLDVERTKRKAPPNQLAKVFGDTFFFPLVSRHQQDIAAYGSASLFSSTPFVLVTFLKTVALLFHASGIATLGLPDISTALWDLLLSLRVRATQDFSVLEAVLFGLLTVLEINGGYAQRIAQENPKHLVETQQWVEQVFERVGGGEMVTEGSEEEKRIRSLAAGALVKTREMIEAYQGLLMGR